MAPASPWSVPTSASSALALQVCTSQFQRFTQVLRVQSQPSCLYCNHLLTILANQNQGFSWSTSSREHGEEPYIIAAGFQLEEHWLREKLGQNAAAALAQFFYAAQFHKVRAWPALCICQATHAHTHAHIYTATAHSLALGTEKCN